MRCYGHNCTATVLNGTSFKIAWWTALAVAWYIRMSNSVCFELEAYTCLPEANCKWSIWAGIHLSRRETDDATSARPPLPPSLFKKRHLSRWSEWTIPTLSAQSKAMPRRHLPRMTWLWPTNNYRWCNTNCLTHNKANLCRDQPQLNKVVDKSAIVSELLQLVWAWIMRNSLNSISILLNRLFPRCLDDGMECSCGRKLRVHAHKQHSYSWHKLPWMEKCRERRREISGSLKNSCAVHWNGVVRMMTWRRMLRASRCKIKVHSNAVYWSGELWKFWKQFHFWQVKPWCDSNVVQRV